MTKQHSYNGLITVDADDNDEWKRNNISTGIKIMRKISSPALLTLSFSLFLLLLLFGKHTPFQHITLRNSSSSNQQQNTLLFFNVEKSKNLLSELPLKHYPKGGPCIATLVTNRTKDVDELQTALKSLAFLRGDKDPHNLAPILIFNEGDMNPQQVHDIVQSTNRPISFPLVDFSRLPEGFDPSSEDSHFYVKGRKAWGYYQMIRFWITGIWKHPAIEHFETIMRIDSDSCFKEINDYLPNLHNDHLFYHSQYVGVEDGVEFITGLFEFAESYMKTTRAPPEPRNWLLWDFIRNTYESKQSLPLFRSNFEVSRKSFMQRPDVARWHESLTEHEPFGVFRNRWGDAVTRFLMAAIFDNNDRFFTIKPTGYFHKIGCSNEEVEQALMTLK